MKVKRNGEDICENQLTTGGKLIFRRMALSLETVFRVAIGRLTAISSGEVKLLEVEIPGDE